MKVTDFSAEEHAPDEAQQRISEVTVQERHRPRRYPAGKTVAHHEVIAGTQLGDEWIETGEIVAVVRVPHDDETPARRRHAGPQRRAVAAFRHRDDPRAAALRQSDRSV